MSDDSDHGSDLRDVVLADEIELVSDLVVAASSSPRHFTRDEVDALLGVAPSDDGADADVLRDPGDVASEGDEAVQE